MDDDLIIWLTKELHHSYPHAYSISGCDRTFTSGRVRNGLNLAHQ
jgi:hypothetical protein